MNKNKKNIIVEFNARGVPRSSDWFGSEKIDERKRLIRKRLYKLRRKEIK